MIKTKKIIALLSMLIIFSLCSVQRVNANEKLEFEKLEYTDEYKEWLYLSEEEKNNSLMPRMYKLQTDNEKYLNTTNNPIKINQLL